MSRREGDGGGRGPGLSCLIPHLSSLSLSHHHLSLSLLHLQNPPQPGEEDGVDRDFGRARWAAARRRPRAAVQVGRRAQLRLLLLGGRHAAAQGFATHGGAGQDDDLEESGERKKGECEDRAVTERSSPRACVFFSSGARLPRRRNRVMEGRTPRSGPAWVQIPAAPQACPFFQPWRAGPGAGRWGVHTPTQLPWQCPASGAFSFFFASLGIFNSPPAPASGPGSSPPEGCCR